MPVKLHAFLRCPCADDVCPRSERKLLTLFSLLRSRRHLSKSVRLSMFERGANGSSSRVWSSLFFTVVKYIQFAKFTNTVRGLSACLASRAGKLRYTPLSHSPGPRVSQVTGLAQDSDLRTGDTRTLPNLRPGDNSGALRGE